MHLPAPLQVFFECRAGITDVCGPHERKLVARQRQICSIPCVGVNNCLHRDSDHVIIIYVILRLDQPSEISKKSRATQKVPEFVNINHHSVDRHWYCERLVAVTLSGIRPQFGHAPSSCGQFHQDLPHYACIEESEQNCIR